MGEFPDTLERLTARLEILERRVESIEALAHPAAVLSAPIAITQATTPAAEFSEELSPSQASGAFAILGKAMLGIAGAYVLRAVAESSSLPKLAIAAIAIVYALLWLVGAVRVQAGAWFASAIYAATSALILAPMLWELTLSFKVLPAPATAGILGAFVIAATALAWKQDRTPVFWVANAAAAGSAFVLSIATYELAPFIAVLLLMALLCEFAATRRHEVSLRPLVAASADTAILALIFIYSSPESMRMIYPAIGATGLILPGCLLFLIYGTSMTFRSVLRCEKISVFETCQATIAFSLAASSMLFFATRLGAIALGAVCLFFSAACYAAAILLFDKGEGRNYHVFAAWAACLLLAGSALSLPPFWLAVCLGLAAVAASISADRLTLKFHGMVFLVAAAVASNLFEYVFHALAGTLPASPPSSIFIVSAFAVACYAVTKHRPSENWKQKLLRLVPAALAVCALAALLTHALLFLVALRITPEAHHVAFIRTLILCAAALALAFGGSRWHGTELTQIAYATLGFVAVKLLIEDLRLGHLEFIAASIFLFAITLIAVPRLARIGQKACAAVPHSVSGY